MPARLLSPCSSLFPSHLLWEIPGANRPGVPRLCPSTSWDTQRWAAGAAGHARMGKVKQA